MEESLSAPSESKLDRHARYEKRLDEITLLILELTHSRNRGELQYSEFLEQEMALCNEFDQLLDLLERRTELLREEGPQEGDRVRLRF